MLGQDDCETGRQWAEILAVIPIHPSFSLPSATTIEDMPDKAFDVFIDALERHGDDFLHCLNRALSEMRDLLLGGDLTSRYKFESAEGKEGCEPGSRSTIESCAMDQVT